VSLPDLTSAQDFQNALADLELEANIHPLIRNALQDQILRAWLASDPTSALEHAEAVVVEWGESFGKELFRVWLDLDPESALQTFTLASPALRGSVFQSFFTQFADLDPQRTLELMNDPSLIGQGTISDPRGEVYAHAYQRWAETDPRSALEHYKANLLGKQMAGYSHWPLTRIFETWAKSDPLAALEFVRGIRSSDQKIASSYHQMTSIEPAIARFILSEDPDLIAEFENPEYSSSSWVEADLDGALVFADSLPKNHLWRAHLLVKAAERLATTDPARALVLYLEGQSSPAVGKDPWGQTHIGFPDSFYHEAFQNLNARDPANAGELLDSVPEKHRALALGGIFTQEFAKNPSAAIDRIKDYYQEPAHREIVDKALSRSLEWGRQAPSEVIAAIPEARRLIQGEVLESWARKEPEAAASFISEELKINPAYETKNNEALSYLAAARPEFTARWLETLPEGNIQINAAVALAAHWSIFDLPATKAWIETLPAGQIKEVAAETLAKSVD